ncbi:MAG TPA: hypothetical protein VN700_07170 [Vicinamibacterales bacterium]|nr:hypothetical protein [Vicinamibacterales bacterium]
MPPGSTAGTHDPEAHEIGALVWSLDSDFQKLEKLKIVCAY